MTFESPERILLHRDRLEKIFRGKIVKPATLDLELSWACNHSCEWCIYRTMHQNIYMPMQEVVRVLSFCRSNEVPWIILSGAGEPTLHPEFNSIIQLLEDYKLKYVLFTNGSNLEQFSENLGNSCRYLRISLDAATPQTYEKVHHTPKSVFNKILDNIRIMRHYNNKLHIGLSFVIHHSNVCEISKFIKLASSLEINEVLFRKDIRNLKVKFNVNFRNLPKPKNTIIVWRDIIKKPVLKASHCYGAALKMVIDPNGNVPLCCIFRDKDNIIGNIKSMSLENIWYSNRHKEALSKINLSKCPPCRLSQCNIIVERYFSTEGCLDII